MVLVPAVTEGAATTGTAPGPPGSMEERRARGLAAPLGVLDAWAGAPVGA